MEKSETLYINPLYSGKLRNVMCICGSGKKIKRCHGRDFGIDVIMLNEINRLIDKVSKERLEAVYHDDRPNITHKKAP